MRKLRYTAAGILMLLCLLLPLTVSAYPNERDGFRDWRWGTDFDTVSSQLVFIREWSGDRNFKVYEKKNEDLVLSKIKLKFIHYVFWRNKLYKVEVLPQDGYFAELQNALFLSFGKKEMRYGTCDWFGAKTSMTLFNDKYRDKEWREQWWLKSEAISDERRRWGESQSEKAK